ncbi:MAG: L,D-transpeptidase [Polyangiaceae bacterium]
MPTAAMQRRREAALDAWLEKAEQARKTEGEVAIAAIDKSLIGVDLVPAGIAAPQLFDVGPRVREARTGIAPTSTVAWTRTFDGEGRSWLLTADHAVMPRDKVRPYPRSRFSGVHLDEATRLPLAFFRKTDKPKYRRGQDGTFSATGESWGVRTFTALTGESTEHDGERYWQTREPDIWARDDDATVVRAAEKAPRLPVQSARNTWLEISVQKGWLIAYEGERPVFATLISPGRGGVPVPGKDPLETASTPTGTFRVVG